MYTHAAADLSRAKNPTMAVQRLYKIIAGD